MGQLSPAAMVAPLLMALAGLWTLLPSNATLCWAWPWFPLWFIGLAILLSISALSLFAPGSAPPGSGPERHLRTGFLVFLAAPLAASFNAPDHLRSVASAGGLALGAAAVLVALSRPENREWMRPGGKLAGLLTVFALVWGLASLSAYTFLQRGPFMEEVCALDERFGDGKGVMFPLMIDVEQMRNTMFFGHANLVAGFALLLFPFPLSRLLAGERKVIPVATLVVLSGVLFSAESRLALLALAAGVSVGVLGYGPAGRRLRLLLLAGIALAVFAAASVAWSGRMRAMLSLDPLLAENEDMLNRASQVEAAWITGLRHFPVGAGEGTAPAHYERLRPELMGSVDGILHYHFTPGHLWAVYGVFGLLGAGLLTAFVWRAAGGGKLSPHVGGLLAWSISSMGDYNLDQPGHVILLGVNLACLAVFRDQPARQTTSPRPWIAGLVCALWIPFLGAFLIRHLPARIAIEDYFELPANSPTAERLVEFNRAHTPADPYLLNVHAARLMKDNPSDPKAVEALKKSLLINPDQEFAHTWLAWALLPSAPDQAAIHFRASLRLNARVAGLGEGLGRAYLASGRRQEAIRAFSAHSLQFPHFLLGDRWLSPDLKDLQREVLEATVNSASKLLAKPNLSKFLFSRVTFVRDLALARLGGRGEVLLRSYLAPRHPPIGLFFQAWDHPEYRKALIERALAAKFRPDTGNDTALARQGQMADRMARLFQQSGPEPLAFFLMPSDHYLPELPRANFGVLQGHSRSLSPVLPWNSPLGLPESVFFGEFAMGLTASDFDWVLELPDKP